MFVHLHVHTEFSLLDGAARIKSLVKAAKEMNMEALAITDHGTMFGVVDFYRACQKEGIKPILGCEVYVAPRTMGDKVSHIDNSLYHLVLLAENQEGYRNLLQIVSVAYTEGFYYKPRIDKEYLKGHSKGIIALSACIAGEVPSAIIKDDEEKALKSALELLDIFGEGNFYLELQNHGFTEQEKANKGIIKLHEKTGIPLVVTNDVHYVYREHAEMQDILMCIQMGKTVDDPSRMKFQSQELYLKSEEEMSLVLGEHKDAFKNTWEIARRCNVELSFGTFHLPEFFVPRGYNLDSYLRGKCEEGIAWRYGEKSPEILERLDYELDTIKQMGYSAYFLIVWDFIHFARTHKIPVGPGRGSAAGSIVAYLLGITNLDPLKYDLLFERFLNPERVSMPDIDIDFCFERRGEVIQYVTSKYGADKVAQIATFGTMAARAAIRDVGRVLDIPYGEVDKVAKMVPTELHITLEKALQDSSDLKAIYQEDSQIKKLIDMAILLEGMPRHASTHAAGVVITKEPLTHYVPLYKTTDGPLTTQFPKDQVEELGLLKMDLLGLRTLTVISDALKLIEQNQKIKIDIDAISLEDKKSYEMLIKGESVGVFQLESSGMRSILKDLRPEVFEDLVALVALYRPGPLGSGMVDDFVKNKHGLKKVTYLHPQLEPILKDTYGVILYQEQVMRISSDLAGFSLGEADLLRRAMGKKKPEIIAGLRKQFIDGAVNNQVDEKVAGQIFDLMEYFAGYGFNKSHSAAYALVSYQTAFLKANYPVEFMSALLTSVNDNTDKIIVYIEECRRMGIEVLAPDINESKESFTALGNKIRFGLAAIKNVGMVAVERIIEIRQKDGLYKNFIDFCERLDTKVVNKRVLESLIKAGTFKSLGYNCAQLIQVLDLGLDLAQKKQKERQNGQLSLLDFWGEKEAEESFSFKIPQIEDYPKSELLLLEKESLGLYISGHPLGEYRRALSEINSGGIIELKENMETNALVTLAGMFQNVKRLNTKKGDPMAFALLEDLTGNIEVVFFPKAFQKFKELIKTDIPVILKGRITIDGEETKIIGEELLELGKKTKKELYLKVGLVDQYLLAQVKALLKNYPGEIPVLLYNEINKKLFRTSKEHWVNLQTPLQMELNNLLGGNNVRIKETQIE